MARGPTGALVVLERPGASQLRCSAGDTRGWGVAKRLRRGTLNPVFEGSNPSAPAKRISCRCRLGLATGQVSGW